MPLAPYTYYIQCDVPGCYCEQRDKLEILNHAGWRQRIMQEGKPSLVDILPYAPVSVYLCPGCIKDGNTIEGNNANAT